MGGQKTELKMIRMSEVESQEVKWLWYPFIPYGKLTIIQGDPGDGKTTLVLNIAANPNKSFTAAIIVLFPAPFKPHIAVMPFEKDISCKLFSPLSSTLNKFLLYFLL